MPDLHHGITVDLDILVGERISDGIGVSIGLPMDSVDGVDRNSDHTAS